MLILDPLSALIPPNLEPLIPDDLTASQDHPRGPTPELSDISPAIRALASRLVGPLLPSNTDVEQATRAHEDALDNAVRETTGVLGLAKVPVQSLETAFAFATASIGAAFELPAANIAKRSVHFGLPHLHKHPPACPYPLPSIGSLFLGGTQSVLINKHPAARAGDLGLAITCGSFTPFFKVTTGSSKVFFGPNRAARSLDLTEFCKSSSKKPSPSDKLSASSKVSPPSKSWFEKLPDHDSTANIVNAGVKSVAGMINASAASARAHAESHQAMAQSLAAESEGHALTAVVQAKHALVSAAVKATSTLVGLDGAVGLVLPGALSVMGTNVLIGGFPTPPTLKYLVGLKKGLSASTAGFALAFTAGVYCFSPMERRKNALARHLNHYTGHPVDVVTGNLVFDACDLDLPGALPLRLTRSYSSTWSARDSPLGHGWSHSLDEAVWIEPRHLVYRAEDGRELELPRSDDPEIYVPLHRLTLRRTGPDRWQIEDHSGIRRDFAAIVGDPRTGVARLVQRVDRAGHSLHLRYDDRARLVSARADGDREIRLHYGANDRLIQIDLPDPDGDGHLPHIRYVHDRGDLVEVHDALGQVTRYRHDRHRIVQETFPNGLSFHFEYDGDTSDAACVRTWGDGGLLDHRLIYDRARRATLVINACNETTTYRADPRGLVTEITDPRGAVTRFEYDERLRLTATVDALGHVTRREYDARGNCTRTVNPDGTAMTTEYHPTFDLPVMRVDGSGGVSRSTYDTQGRVIRHTDPLGRSTVHQHEVSSGACHVEAIVHADGRSELRSHDTAGRLLRHRPPDGSCHSYRYDRRGRLRHRSDGHGRSESHEYDLLDRLTRHTLPNGETRLYTHDARGRIIRACDDRNDLRCGYTGLGWLASCGEANAAPCTVERDLEGRVTRVAGPSGTLLRIDRDAAGRVRTTVDALGIERRYTRDLLGHVVAIRHPGGKMTRYTRDAVGRIIEVDHGDGMHDSFAYRADGALQIATRRHTDDQVTTVRRDFDALGRVTREHQDSHLIALEYDLRDRLTRLRSSLGADLRFVYDERGLTRINVPHEPWALAFERDRDGQEQARHLPGEILSWWQSDSLGRPSAHGIVASRPPQIHRQRRYSWTHVRLDCVEETTRRRPSTSPPTPSSVTLRHDTEGRRVAADLSDGTLWKYTWNDAGELSGAATTDISITYRHDALGRRIARIRDGIETRWLWHGDVPLHSWAGQSGHDPTTWVFAPGGFSPLARLTSTSRHAFVGDHLGTPLAAFDERGQLVWAAEFDERGQPYPVRGDPALCPFRFPGQLADPDTGLSYNRFREYDPATGRYLSPDPLGLLGGLDPHAYVDDPQTSTDVFGLSTDRPTSVQAYVAAQLTLDFSLADVAPPLADVVVRKLVGPTDLQTLVAGVFHTPHRGPCE